MLRKFPPKICTYQKFRVMTPYKIHVGGFRKFCLQTPLKIRSRRSKAKFSAQNHFDKKFSLFDAPKPFQTEILLSKPLRQENFSLRRSKDVSNQNFPLKTTSTRKFSLFDAPKTFQTKIFCSKPLRQEIFTLRRSKDVSNQNFPLKTTSTRKFDDFYKLR